MPLYRIPREMVFPNPRLAEPSGLLGVGGDLSPERLLLGYSLGIFPWFSRGQPILWWSPDPRAVLRSADLHVPRSLGKRIRRGDYVVTMDKAFAKVIHRCGAKPRPGQSGTWITQEMERAYLRLHELGFAHSCEAWKGDVLVGGLYGVAVGRLYAGESMFADTPDASKVAFVHMTRQLARWGFPLVDCQMMTAHLERFGAIEIPRGRYLDEIAALVREPGRPGAWTFDRDFVPDTGDGA